MRDTFPIIVHTLLWQRGALLLLRRSATGYLDGYFALPGGHLQQGEGIIDCAIRECREEAGVDLARAGVRPLAVLPYRIKDGQGVNFIMSCDDFAGQARLAEPDRFDQLCWADPAALPERTVPYVADILEMRATGHWFLEFDG